MILYNSTAPMVLLTLSTKQPCSKEGSVVETMAQSGIMSGYISSNLFSLVIGAQRTNDFA
jgi:hypothetical protein